jgi:membrane AbrB-like protein
VCCEKLNSLLAGGSLALIGALIAVWLRTPLPWMLGPLILVAIFSMTSARITSSVNLRYFRQWVVGVPLGFYFIPHVLSVKSHNMWPVIVEMIFALLLGLYGILIFKKFRGVDLRTAWFFSAIGGASEMTSLSERYGGKPELVASAHS